MDWNFSDDQLLFQSTVRDFLRAECTPEVVRAQWASETGHDAGLWKKLAELGVPGLRVPEAHGGMGMDEVDAVLLWEECGRAGLVAPLTTGAVAAPLLASLGDAEVAKRWLPRIAAGDAVVAVGHAASPLVADAGLADLLILPDGDALHAVLPEDARVATEPGNDPGRRLFSVAFRAAADNRLADGPEGAALQAAALDRGALAAAAQQLGVADRLIGMAARYAEQRHQFGRPIGSFQAVKHHLANCKVELEYARPVVQRAAFSVAKGVAERSVHVSMAKALASDAAVRSAAAALQVHGAIGYTWEQDLHLWMRRAWSLEQAFGRTAFHRRRVEAHVFTDGAALGPGTTFERMREE